MKFDLLIFDLDGTLIDSAPDVGSALNRVLADYGIAPLPAAVVRAHVGYGIQPILRETLNAHAVKDVDEAVLRFTPYYFEACAQETVLYDGVAEVLPRLGSFTKVILTNKSTRFIGKILDGLGVAEHFVGRYGRESFAKTKPDPLPIREILREYGVAPERALMIGDTETDIVAGRAAGVATCLVTYGYGRPDVLRTLAPTFTIADIAELPDVTG